MKNLDPKARRRQLSTVHCQLSIIKTHHLYKVYLFIWRYLWL
nr:MAG TPA: hypothetical protein [Bacteriophage sp.]